MKMTSKMKMTKKNEDNLNSWSYFCPRLTSHLFITTDVKLEMILGAQIRNGIPNDRYNIRGIAHACTNRKDDIFMQRRLYIDEAHMALDIFRFAVFFPLRPNFIFETR